MDAYPWFMISATGLGWLLFLWVWRGSGLELDWRVGLVGVTTALAGLAGGRAYALAELWGNGAPHSGWLDGGLRLPGAVPRKPLQDAGLQ